MHAKILVAHDGSENSQRAFNKAIELINNFAEKNKVEILVVSVIQISDLPEIAENQAIIDYFRKYYKEVHSNLAEIAQKNDIKLNSYILVGNPSIEIINFAKENRVDLIVVGKTGKSKIEQWLLGSVSKKIIDHAPCSVLMVN
ncbi:MAG: universal stress protein [bacterium]